MNNVSTRKYEFTGETMGPLRRIRRLSDGEIGGWIERERNLSHYGDARVSGDARVYGHARVSGDARVSGNAQVSASLKMATRSDGYTFCVFPCADGVWRLTAGCRFFTMDEAWRHWMATRGDRKETLGAETLDILWMFDEHIRRQKVRT